MNAFFRGKESLILRIHEAGYKALGAVSAADHCRNLCQRLVNCLPVLFAGVVHRREIAAGNESDLVAVLFVIRGQQSPRILVLLAIVLQGQPADRPGHFAVGAAGCKGISTRADALRAIIADFVFAD